MLTRIYYAAYARALILSENMRKLALRGVYAWAALISPLAMADGDLADIGKNVAEGAKSFQTSGITIVQVVGFFAIVGGIFSIKAMKNNPQIKPWMIVVAILGGIFLMAIPEIIRRSMNQAGLTPVTVS